MWRVLLVCFSVSIQTLLRRVLPVATALVLVLSGTGELPARALSSTGTRSVAPDTTFPVPVGDREALVSLPQNHDPAVAHPLLLVFGGWGADPGEMAGNMGVRDAAVDAIVVYARGVGNAWAGAPYATTSQEEDIAHIREVVDAVAGQYHVNRSRVYALGHSNGGAFALTLACRAPDLVAGVVSVSGMFYEPVDSHCVGGPVPVQIIHDVHDDVARPEGGQRHGAPFLPVQEILDRWAVRNGCVDGSFPVLTYLPYADHQAWSGCHAETEAVITSHRGHGWAGHAPHTAWDFLSRQFH